MSVTKVTDDVLDVSTELPAPPGTPGGSLVAQPGGLLAYLPVFNKVIYGLTYANNAGDAVNDIDIAAGGAMDATGAYFMVGAARTKQSDVAWSVGNNAGGLDTGAVGNSDYYIWLIVRSDTGVVDVLFSLSSTAPVMPANYDYKRLIGWFKRAGGAIVAFKTFETGGGAIDYMWITPTLDIDLAATLTTARRTDPVKVPLNFSVVAMINVNIVDSSAGVPVIIYCPDHTDLTPAVTGALATINTLNSLQHYMNMEIRTSSAGLIAARCGSATVDNYRVSTLGFKWARRD